MGHRHKPFLDPVVAVPLTPIREGVGLAETLRSGSMVKTTRLGEDVRFATRIGRVGDEGVGVELRIAGSRGAVDLGGGEEAVAGDELGAASGGVSQVLRPASPPAARSHPELL
jgi:hypothetical protein